ncbi:MAG TPA: nucleoside-diphosphate sugar epimerase/dehydratase [Gemmatimonadaceae bacterium]|nr:nucleoside-diphosphate sugar epimerase/dehydratase [Gemmatimonadaceae bacterium]
MALPNWIESYGGRAYLAAYRSRRLVAHSAYLVMAAAGYALAYQIRFDFHWPREYGRVFLVTLGYLLPIRLSFALLFGFSTGRWRFVSVQDVLRLVGATTLGTAVFWLFARGLHFEPPVPRSVIVLEGMLTALLTAGMWVAYRTAFEMVRQLRDEGPAQRSVMIVGAGEAGNMLAREMLRHTKLRPVGFVDDEPTRQGLRIQNARVVGTVSDLPRVVRDYGAEEIFIAVPSASPAELRRIVEQCERCGVPFKVLPGIAEVLGGSVSLRQLRDVRIEDILGREPVHLTLPELASDLAGQSVLITGAAGSIGSELARQVALHGPGTLVLLDQAETELFYLELDLQERHSGLRLVPVVGDVTDVAVLGKVFREYRPSRVFHAAAYKHVPMMEANPREAIRNNVIGTWRLAEAAGRSGVEKFVLVSTDKAVRPVNVMGATKRVAEQVVLALQERFPQTGYCAVRFGNVLGSAGSVIPIFRRQVEAGKPLTVTHPDATRYFMTIPEASQLILQASLLPESRGHVVMLDMGEPVRIRDLAANLLDLWGVGRHSGRIVFTGLRPGERLHEELMDRDETTVPTSVARVKVVCRTHGVQCDILDQLPHWEDVLAQGSDSAALRLVEPFFDGQRGARLLSAERRARAPVQVDSRERERRSTGGA